MHTATFKDAAGQEVFCIEADLCEMDAYTFYREGLSEASEGLQIRIYETMGLAREREGAPWPRFFGAASYWLGFLSSKARVSDVCEEWTRVSTVEVTDGSALEVRTAREFEAISREYSRLRMSAV